jgi:hypothetical protein
MPAINTAQALTPYIKIHDGDNGGNGIKISFGE